MTEPQMSGPRVRRSQTMGLTDSVQTRLSHDPDMPPDDPDPNEMPSTRLPPRPADDADDSLWLAYVVALGASEWNLTHRDPPVTGDDLRMIADKLRG